MCYNNSMDILSKKCKNCGKEFHKKYGRNNNTQKQLNEFLGF
jgi:hypothetical protein